MNHKPYVVQLFCLTLVIILLTTGCGAKPAPTQTPVPTNTVGPSPTATFTAYELAHLNPSPRGYFTMAYDIESNRIILFGGQTGDPLNPSNFDGETWAYDSTANKWMMMQPVNAPTPRSAPALAYDTESDRIILYGGASPNIELLADTWAYDYNTDTWTQVSDAPHPYNGARLAYDSESDRIICFCGDTLAYDYNSDTWTTMNPSILPLNMNYQAMTYDSKADRVLLWQEINLGAGQNIPMMYAYDYNTDTWTKIPPADKNHPWGATYGGMAYDSESDRSILFGNLAGEGTWAYDYNTNTWTNMNISISDQKVIEHAIAYATEVDRIIFFGGELGNREYNYRSETWSYDYNTNTWTNMTRYP